MVLDLVVLDLAGAGRCRCWTLWLGGTLKVRLRQRKQVFGCPIGGATAEASLAPGWAQA
jgi:hypothetical protein